MSEIVQIIHELNYRVSGNGMQEAAAGLKAQLSLINIQGEQLKRLQRIYDSTSTNETAKRQRLLQMMERERKSMRANAAATEHQILTDRRLQQGMEREIGILGTLQLKLDLLRKARTAATSEQDIRNYDRQIRQLETRMSRLNDTSGGGGIQGQILQGLGVGAGFGIADIVGSGLSALKDFIRESSALAKEAEGVERAFTRLNKPDLLSDLRSATKGTVSDLELMKQTVQFNNFQLPVDKLSTALAFARQRARDTGASVDYLVQSIVTGIARQSPLILDNLGINIKRVQEEFKSTGDFALAAFNIIEEETRKSGVSVEGFADKTDRLATTWDNFKVKAGVFFQGVGSGITYLVRSFVDMGAQNAEDAADRLAESQKEAQERMSFDYASYLRRYEGATKEGKAAILNQVEIFEGRIRQAEQQSMAQGQINAVNYYRGLISMFQRFRVDIAKTVAVPKTLEQQNVPELEKVVSRNRELIAGYSTEDLKDPSKLAERNRLDAENKKAQKYIDQINGTEQKVKKVRTKSHDSQYSLEADLTKRIADLRYQQNALKLKDEADTTDKIRKETDARIEKDNEELDAQIENARKRKLLTDRAKADFETIRTLLTQNAEIDFTTRSEELLRGYKSRSAQYGIDADKYELESTRTRAGASGIPSLFNIREQIGKERAIAVKEENKRFDDLKEVYRKEGRAIEEIQIEHNDRLELLNLQFFQRDASAHLDYLEELKKQLDRATAQQLAAEGAQSADEAESIRGHLHSGNISKRKYYRLRERADLRRAIREAQVELDRAEADFKNKDEAQASLGEQSRKVSADPSSSTARKNTAEQAFQKAKQEANEAKAALTKARDGLEGANRDFTSRQKVSFAQGVEGYQILSNAAVGAYNQIADAAQRAADAEIAARQRRLTDAQRLAERGNVDVLRIEEERLEKAERMKQQYAERQQAINSGLAASEAAVAIAKTAADSSIAAPIAIPIVIAALIAGIAAIQSMGFAEGGYTGDGSKYAPAGTVHKGEVVFSQKDVAAAGGWKQLDAFRKGLHAQPYAAPILPEVAQPVQNDSKALAGEIKELKTEMRGVVDALSSLSSPGVNLDREGIAVITLEQDAKNRKRWGNA
ncbi:MAG: hypothetical protein EOP52_13525 [Sphingobacteriales bacterium]|nr:MAG: hypothetical protein EOP52_13525 [Sphingobacteriales bacterium]